jgi:pantoate--beta-alanine ligase
MKIFKTILETQNYIKSNSVGFVPTMGALHAGHISLIKQAKLDNELSVCSIFVNPTQFNNPEDLVKYPRTLEADIAKLEEAGCDVVFIPEVSEIYPNPVSLSVNFGRLEEILEGAFRPGHFNGVGIVVSKLFHIIKPTKAYFGLKDLQQCAVINRLVKDLSFDLELVFCDTVREEDGLAMSSRNVRLDAAGRKAAPFINSSLRKGKDLILNGTSPEETKRIITADFAARAEFELEYFEVVDFETLESIETYDNHRKTAMVTAAHLGGVRLIDNIVF